MTRKTEVDQRYTCCIYHIVVKRETFPNGMWMSENMKGKWCSEYHVGKNMEPIHRFMFELHEDAMLFALRWQ